MDMKSSNPVGEEMMDMDEIELTLRRFAMSKEDRALTNLLNSMFPSAEDKVKHETSTKDVMEDKKEGD